MSAQSRLRESGMLPSGWIDCSDVMVSATSPSLNSGLVLCKARAQQALPGVGIGLTLRIEPSLSWHLFLSSEMINECSLLTPVPIVLNSVSLVVSLLKMVDGAQICLGNQDNTFLELSAHHKGVFLDSTGIK